MATSPDRMEAETPARGGLAPVQITLIVLGVLLIFLLGYFLFLRGGDDSDLDAGAPPVEAPETPVEPETEVEEEPDGAEQRRPVETFEVFAPKDPFDPLISAATEGTGATSTTAAPGEETAPGADASEGDAATGGSRTTFTSEGDGTGTSGAGSESVDGHRVRVIDVYREGTERRAQVQVDSTVHTVTVGDRFASNFQLLSTSRNCATMLYGDDEFTLCEGEEILK